jgi:uncharacterized protein (DUF1501 family)
MNPTNNFSPARRRWLQRSLAGTASAFGAGSLANLLAAAPAQAADYKALVCIFLYGGNDGMNTIVPTDATRHAQYAAVRKGLAVPRSSLAALSGSDFGLHPAMSALQSVWNKGQLAPVFNVGPLYRPLTKAEYRSLSANSAELPESLFSHSHQQALWETSSTIATERTGWGGRASQTLGTTNPVISVGGNGRFGLSSSQVPLVLPSPGASFGLAGLTGTDLNPSQAQARLATLKTMYASSSSNQLMSAYNRQQREAFEMATRLGDLIKVKPGSSSAGNFAAIDAAFAGLTVNGALQTSMAKQLYQVAKLIAANTTVQGSRQIFFAQLDGFDLHASQAASANVPSGQHAKLLAELGDAMAAFQSAMDRLGMSDQVTAFTQSDFGRTFTPNNSLGTDHAWGNHHLVMGGAVKGKATYGRYPELVLGGADDVGSSSWEMQGRWIPSSSVDQYAATLLRWFGASDGQLDTVLPNLSNFGSKRTLGFV